ncbi:MAG: hypothetical protein WC538_15870 [Thermoanaerobaculia bacterium]|jgi:hypothetical protein
MNDDDHQKAHSLLELLYLAKDGDALRRYAGDPAVPDDIRVHASALLARPLLPWGAHRKIVMLLLVTGVVAGAAALRSPWLLVLLVVPLSFSPRLVAECFLFVARLRRNE